MICLFCERTLSFDIYPSTIMLVNFSGNEFDQNAICLECKRAYEIINYKGGKIFNSKRRDVLWWLDNENDCSYIYYMNENYKMTLRVNDYREECLNDRLLIYFNEEWNLSKENLIKINEFLKEVMLFK